MAVSFALFGQHNSPRIPEKFDLADYPRIAEELLTHLENHGYPFATVTLQSTDPEQGDFTPRIIIDTNLFVTFDSIVLKGDVRLARGFLYPYLGLRRGKPYNEQQMRQVAAKLEELPFATVVREPGVAFVKDKAYLYVYLDKRQTSRFDGYIGLVPVDERTGKVSVTGQLDLALQNLFHVGESILLEWNSSERHSQKLDLSVRFPFLFRTRFGIESSFRLDKQDTSYLTLDFHLGIPYAFAPNSHIEPYFNLTSSSVLSPALARLDCDTSYIDYRKTLYGVRFRFRKLDYLFNPRRGVDLGIDLSAGRRTLLPNRFMEEETYNNIIKQRASYRITGDLRGYIPIGRHWVIAPRLQGGSLLNGPHYDNELFKIAGVERLRGFNPNDLCASTYLLYSAEVRFLFAKRSYAHIFFDGGVYEQHTESRYLRDTPFGFGAGVNLAVRSGTFYLEYALGRQMKNPISLKRGLIHFGIKVDF